MANDVGVFIEGDLKLALEFERFPAAAHDALLARITSITSQLANRVRAGSPDLTGRLRRQIKNVVFDDKDKITGAVYIAGDDPQDFAKAGALEWGAPGKRPKTKVKSHDMRLDHVFGHKLKAPITVLIEAHNRTAHIIATKFERGPFDQMRGGIEKQLRDALATATEGVQ